MKMEWGCRVMFMILSFYILCCSLVMSHCHGIVEVAAADETLTNFEDLEIEQRLKLINKPAVKIIKTINGESYGCVDFYKQPALDHPSMKNHMFHYKMRMKSYPEGSKMQRETHRLHSNNTFGHLWENGVGCSIGTVPIRRVTRENLLRLKSFGGHNSNIPRSSWNSTYKPTSFNNGYVAVVRTKGKPRIYNGASMDIAIDTPMVEPNQFSSGRMHFQIGYEYIQVGWTVNPRLYGDAISRLYLFTNAGGQSCYNSFCPSGYGMVLVRQDWAPGLVLDQIDIEVAILKDKVNGNWWLMLDTTMEEIGFWPSERFKESYGTGVEWGGEVYSSYILPTPPMGNGHIPLGTPKKDSFIRRITTVDRNYKTDKKVENSERFLTNNHCYDVRHATESFWKHTGHLILYGGPGCK